MVEFWEIPWAGHNFLCGKHNLTRSLQGHKMRAMEHIFKNKTLSLDITSFKLDYLVVLIVASNFIFNLGTFGIDQ